MADNAQVLFFHFITTMDTEVVEKLKFTVFQLDSIFQFQTHYTS